MKNEEKRRWETEIFSIPFPEVFLMTLGVENGGEISKNLSEMRSENENGDFSRIVLKCTRQHDFGGSGTSRIGQKSERKRLRDDVGDRVRKMSIFCRFGKPFGSQNRFKKVGK